MDIGALNCFLRRQIRRIREEKRLTVTEVARRAGIPISSYSSLETGAYCFTLASLHKVVSALNVDIAEIWPPFWKAKVHISFDRLKEVDQINWFRLREILLRSGADSLCLVQPLPSKVEFLAWINLSDKDRNLLHGAFLCKPDHLERDGWQLVSRTSRNSVLLLCLKNANVPVNWPN